MLIRYPPRQPELSWLGPPPAIAPESLNMSTTQLQFSIGGYTGTCHEVEWKQGKLWYRRANGAYQWQADVAITPTEEQWTNFWRAMETAGVWSWQESYDNLTMLDGTQWSLKLKYRERRVRCEGSNAYPGSADHYYSPTGEFAHFLKALRTLTDQPAIQ